MLKRNAMENKTMYANGDETMMSFVGGSVYFCFFSSKNKLFFQD